VKSLFGWLLIAGFAIWFFWWIALAAAIAGIVWALARANESGCRHSRERALPPKVIHGWTEEFDKQYPGSESAPSRSVWVG